MRQDSRHIRWFEEIKIEDIPVVGGKNALKVTLQLVDIEDKSLK